MPDGLLNLATTAYRRGVTSLTITGDSPLPASASDLFALTKPRVMTLVVFTGLCGLLAAPGSVNPILGFTAVLCIALGAGAAGALNQWYEVDLDAKMKRTAQRPLPAGRMTPQTALHFGVGLSAFSVILMGLATNYLAAAILLVRSVSVVYTILLRVAGAYTVIACACAFPPLSVWRATGRVDPAVIVFAIIFLWTPTAFRALSRSCDRYATLAYRFSPWCRAETTRRLSRSTTSRWWPQRLPMGDDLTG